MTKATIREEHRSLSYQELLDKAYELGFNYEKNSWSCCQCTVAALHEILEIDDVVVKVASTSAGGQASQGVGTCGGLIGGTIALDYFFGRPVENMSYKEWKKANTDMVMEATAVAKLLYDKYVEEYGTIICPHIVVQCFGRHYYFFDPNEMEQFEKDGGHSDPDKCCHVVGTAAKWAMEILHDKGVLEL